MDDVASSTFSDREQPTVSRIGRWHRPDRLRTVGRAALALPRSGPSRHPDQLPPTPRLAARAGAGHGGRGAAGHRPVGHRRAERPRRGGLVVSHHLRRAGCRPAAVSPVLRRPGDARRSLAQRPAAPTTDNMFRAYRVDVGPLPAAAQRAGPRLPLARRGPEAKAAAAALEDEPGESSATALAPHQPAGPHPRLVAARPAVGPVARRPPRSTGRSPCRTSA